ncbi:hypothetical protein WJ970_29135 [Achromobacter xylosoxidans]
MDSIQDGRHARAASNAGAAVPYFCQWESAHLAGAIIRGELDLKDDPAWAGSGAAVVDEYARWASHVCGMACLKMVLAARTGRVHPTLALARASLPYGAYTVDGDDIKGMIYAPFVRYVEEAYGLRARVHVTLQRARYRPCWTRPSSSWRRCIRRSAGPTSRRRRKAGTWCW